MEPSRKNAGLESKPTPGCCTVTDPASALSQVTDSNTGCMLSGYIVWQQKNMPEKCYIGVVHFDSCNEVHSTHNLVVVVSKSITILQKCKNVLFSLLAVRLCYFRLKQFTK